jgi:hypothetical protein
MWRDAMFHEHLGGGPEVDRQRVVVEPTSLGQQA